MCRRWLAKVTKDELRAASEFAGYDKAWLLTLVDYGLGTRLTHCHASGCPDLPHEKLSDIRVSSTAIATTCGHARAYQGIGVLDHRY